MYTSVNSILAKPPQTLLQCEKATEYLLSLDDPQSTQAIAEMVLLIKRGLLHKP